MLVQTAIGTECGDGGGWGSYYIPGADFDRDCDVDDDDVAILMAHWGNLEADCPTQPCREEPMPLGK